VVGSVAEAPVILLLVDLWLFRIPVSFQFCRWEGLLPIVAMEDTVMAIHEV
jgi:hypothetical protein